MQSLIQALSINAAGILQQSDYNNRRSTGYADKIIKELSTPAELKQAKIHRNENSIRKVENGKLREFTYWCSSTIHFAKYSLGFQLHFLLLKQLIVVFFAIALVSIVQLYLNYKGNYYTGGEVVSDLNYFSLGDQYGIRPEYQNITNIDQDKVNLNYLLTWSTDTFNSGYFLLMIFVFFLQAYLDIRKNILDSNKISEYSIEVKGIPRTGVDVSEIRQHFSKFGEVIEVYLARRYNDLLYYYTTRSDLIQEIKLAETLLRFNEKDLETDKKLNKLKSKLGKFDEKIKKEGDFKSHDNLEIKKAYIVFNNKKEKISCLRQYNKKSCCCLVQKKNLRFRGTHMLRISQPPEPSDIIWENLEVGKCSKFVRFLVSFTLTLMLLLVSVVMIYYVKTTQSNLPSQSECSAINSTSPDTSKYSLQTMCYCQQLSTQDLTSKSTEICSVYVGYLTLANVIKFLSSFGIMIINFFLKIMMRKLSKFERSQSRSRIQKRVFKKVFVVLFINTAVLTYLVNLDIPSFSKYILNGQYNDFTRDWYLHVGYMILILMMISVGSPHLIYLAISYPIGACKRKCCWKSRKSQYELNQLYTGPDFEISTRTSQILNVIFTSYLYSGGIPLLNCTCLLFLILIYYTDKFLVLRHFRSPPSYDHSLYMSAIKLLPLAVILHSCLSLYMYGNQDIFRVSNPKNTTLSYIFGDNIAYRLEIPSGIANCLLIVSAVGLILLLNFLDLLCQCCAKKLLKTKRNELKFSEIKNHPHRVGLDTYDIRKNPEYAMIVNAMDESSRLNSSISRDHFESLHKSASSRNETLFPPGSVVASNCIGQVSRDDSKEDDSSPEFSRDYNIEINMDDVEAEKINSLSDQVNHDEISLRKDSDFISSDDD